MYVWFILPSCVSVDKVVSFVLTHKGSNAHDLRRWLGLGVKGLDQTLDLTLC